MKVIAVDFDGTLCEDNYPYIGVPKYRVIEKLLEEQKDGAKIILWTCREDQLLKEAIEWCKGYGIYFDSVNENLTELVEQYGNNPRKIGATEYWDDKAIKI